MSTTTCPSCGKPLRPGARFCGNCGATLPAAPAQRSEPPPPATDTAVCPNCAKPVRPGARFCNNCGQPIAVDLTETSPDAVLIPASADTLRQETLTQPQAALKPAEPGVAASAAAPDKPGPAKRTSSKALFWIVALVVVIGCGLAAVAGYFAALQFGWLGGDTPLAALPATPTNSSSVVAPPTQTRVVVASPTQLPPTHTATLPSPEPTNTPALETSATRPVTPTEAATAPLPGGVVLFEDTFDDGLAAHWTTWGEPRATIGTGFGDNWLYLKALDPGQAGVTSRPEFVISNAPGAEVEFDAEMDGKYPQAVLIWDWDPETFGRGPDNQDEGVIRLEITAEGLRLFSRTSKESCQQAITGTDKHTFLLRVTEGQGVALYLDGAEQPLCQIASMDLPPQPGKISFSGLGWVSRVKVTVPE